MSNDSPPVRRITYAEWVNFCQGRLGRLEAAMNALRAGILTPMQGRQLDLAMARWDSDHPQFKVARKPEDGDVVTLGDGEAAP